MGLDEQALMERAAEAWERGDYRAAAIDLKTVLQKNPNRADTRVMLGRVSLRLGDYYAAEKELRRAQELGVPKPDVAVELGRAMLGQKAYQAVLNEIVAEMASSDVARWDILRLRGEAELALGNSEAAREYFQEVLNDHAGDAAAWVGMGATHVLESEPLLAEAAFDNAIAVDPNFGTAWLSRGNLRLTRGNIEDAGADFLRALAVSESTADVVNQAAALAGLTETCLAANDIQCAGEYSETLLELAPVALYARYLAGAIAYARGDLDTAYGYLEQVLTEEPGFRPAQLLYGAAHLASEHYAQAEMYLASVLNADPENAKARRLLAEAQLKQRKPSEAVEALAPALLGKDVDGDLLAAAGQASLQAGQATAGVDYLERSLAADPSNNARRLELAVAYLTVDRADDAIELLRGLPQGAAIDYQRDVIVVLALLQKKKAADARKLAEALVVTHPDDPTIRNLLGGVLRATGDPEAARDVFADAIELRPENVAARLNLGRVQMQLGDHEAADLQFGRVLTLDATNSVAMSARGEIAARGGDTATAVHWLEKARESDRLALFPRLMLVQHYLANEQPARALEIADEAAAIAPENVLAQRLRGLALLANADFERAGASFEMTLKMAPESAEPRYDIARARIGAGKLEEARRLLTSNRQSHPEHLPTAILLALVLSEGGENESALKIARELRASESSEAVAYSLEGEMLFRQGRYQEASTAFDRALQREQTAAVAVRAFQARASGGLPAEEAPLPSYLEAHPQDLNVRFVLAEHYQETGRRDDAIQQYERIREMDPENVVAINNLAWLYHEAQRPEATALARQAYEAAPENAYIADTYGWILFNSGEIDVAMGLLQAALARAPDEPEIRYHLAQVTLESGRREEARALLEQALASDRPFPSRQAAVGLLARLSEG